MKMIRTPSLLPALMSVGLALITSISAASGQNELNISQPAFNTGVPITGGTGWEWQSITVPQESYLSTFAFQLNGAYNATATVDLLTGEGTGGSLVATTTGTSLYDDVGSYQGYYFLVADFNNIDLTAGQYTLYLHNHWW